MFLAGAGVRGGRYYGTWPGLTDDDVDLPVTTDYRSVLSGGRAVPVGRPRRPCSWASPETVGDGVMTGSPGERPHRSTGSPPAHPTRREHVLPLTGGAVRKSQWATGGVGRAAVEAVPSTPSSRAGRLLGPLGEASTGSTSARSSAPALGVTGDEQRRRDPGHRGRRGRIRAADPRPRRGPAALLRSARTSSRPVGWFYPTERDERRLRRVRRGWRHLHGTGINPGGTPSCTR